MGGIHLVKQRYMYTQYVHHNSIVVSVHHYSTTSGPFGSCKKPLTSHVETELFLQEQNTNSKIVFIFSNISRKSESHVTNRNTAIYTIKIIN